jgi:hypothetical protein
MFASVNLGTLTLYGTMHCAPAKISPSVILSETHGSIATKGESKDPENISISHVASGNSHKNFSKDEQAKDP